MINTQGEPPTTGHPGLPGALDVPLDGATWAWLQKLAEAHHGDVVAAAAAVINAARAGVHAIPAATLVDFLDGYDPQLHGDDAADLDLALRTHLGLPIGA